MLGAGGEDATKAWEDIQHSEEAQEMMQRYLVGYCPEVSPQCSRGIRVKYLYDVLVCRHRLPREH